MLFSIESKAFRQRRLLLAETLLLGLTILYKSYRLAVINDKRKGAATKMPSPINAQAQKRAETPAPQA